jgi:hypothetical protein
VTPIGRRSRGGAPRSAIWWPHGQLRSGGWRSIQKMDRDLKKKSTKLTLGAEMESPGGAPERIREGWWLDPSFGTMLRIKSDNWMIILRPNSTLSACPPARWLRMSARPLIRTDAARARLEDCSALPLKNIEAQQGLYRVHRRHKRETLD